MAQSVSNDALWEKLSEMDKKFEELIKSDIHTLALSNDSHFEANKKNIQMLNENILKTWKAVTIIRKQQRAFNEPKKEDVKSYFNFKFFKVRKTSFIIIIKHILKKCNLFQNFREK